MRLSLWTFVLGAATFVAAAPKVSFKDPRAKKFQVTQHLPGIPLTVPTSWAGTLPISSAKDSPELFFWYFPPLHKKGEDNLSIWLNGGPGCSSLEGLLQENGPFLLPWNTTDIVYNKYSWTNLTGMLWVEQPAGVGLGKGSKSYTSEKEIAEDFYYFLTQFLDVFKELKGKNLHISGESYAGKYIPYIAHEIYKHSDKENKKNGLNLKGINIADPSFANDFFLEEAPSVPFAIKHQKALSFNDTFIEKLKTDAKANGMTDFADKHLKFPPKGAITVPKKYNTKSYSAWNDIYNAAYEANPYFNVYNIDPIYRYPVTDPLGYPPDKIDPSPNNFLNDDSQGGTAFKKAIHAYNSSFVWEECVNGVFGKSGVDHSSPPNEGVLPFVIEKSKRTLIQHGELDYILVANGSLLAIQNMTWAGKQGFQKRPSQTLLVGGKNAGSFHRERGLTFATVKKSGHMVPQDTPEVSYRLMEYFLGQIDEKDLTK